jgi:DNA-binding response OmpR family regulator
LPFCRVLIVDGDADTRELYRQVFTARGWLVIEASDGREALVRALSEPPSMVVTELWLAFIDGVALCRLLRRDGATASVPILVVTSETRDSYLQQAERAGANAVLKKPSTPDVIMAEMNRLTQTAVARSAFSQSPAGRVSLVKAHQRFETTTPNDPTHVLFCPICSERLIYEKTFFGGVSRRHPERWDYFKCLRCGDFSYRHRTRKLRPLA